ncbi:MAG: CoA transferase, partial [Thermoactinomyces sp.]
PKFWEVFCRGIEREDLIPRLNAPTKEQEKMKRIITSVVRKRTLSDWMNVFAGKDACVSPVLTVAEMVRDPQVIHRQMIVDTEHPEFGTVRLPGIPIKMSEAAGSIRAFAPSLGEHNREYLMELGYSEEEINRLKKEQII